MCCQRQNKTALMIGGGGWGNLACVLMRSLELARDSYLKPAPAEFSDHYRPLPARVCPAPAKILILYIIFAHQGAAINMRGIEHVHSNCKVSTSYSACIIIRHIDILLIFFFPTTFYKFQTTSILITTIHFVFNNL